MVLATALLLAWVLTAFWIALAPGLGLGKRVRAEGPEAHLAKAGTPSMGGVAFLLAAALAYGLHGGDAFRGLWLLGLGFALLGAVAASCYFLLGREAQRRGLSTWAYVRVAYTAAALLLLPLPYLFGGGYGGYPLEVYAYLLLMALLPQLVGHTSFNWATRHIPPVLVTLAILFEPVGASLLAYFLFGELPGSRVLLGALILLVGVALAVVGGRR